MASTTPPERLVGERVVLERATVAHLEGMQAALELSHPELTTWMDWAGDEPQTRDATREFLQSRGPAWEAGSEYGFAVTDPTTSEVIGMCGLMRRIGEGGLEIGYWVRSDRAGRGVATEAARLLTEAALSLPDIDHVEIHHDEANAASGRVPDKLGYTLVERQSVEPQNPGEVGVSLVWRLI